MLIIQVEFVDNIVSILLLFKLIKTILTKVAFQNDIQELGLQILQVQDLMNVYPNAHKDLEIILLVGV